MEEKIIALRKSKESMIAIAVELGLTFNEVRKICLEHNLGGRMASRGNAKRVELKYKQDNHKPVSCKKCGKFIEQTEGGGRCREYCSQKCADKARRKRYLTEKPKHKKKCSKCGNEFETINPMKTYCSNSCSASYRSNKVSKKLCKHCGVPFMAKKASVFCSERCKFDSYNDKYLGVCQQCGIEFRSIQEYQQFCSVKCCDDAKRKPLDITCKRPRNELQRWEYRFWRESVFKRDNFECQRCGDDRGGNLNAHHLDGWDKHPEKRLDIDNGITLCEDCHIEFHRLYGYGGNIEHQFVMFESGGETVGKTS